jgi:hypothetical protein
MLSHRCRPDALHPSFPLIAPAAQGPKVATTQRAEVVTGRSHAGKKGKKWLEKKILVEKLIAFETCCSTEDTMNTCRDRKQNSPRLRAQANAYRSHDRVEAMRPKTTRPMATTRTSP